MNLPSFLNPLDVLEKILVVLGPFWVLVAVLLLAHAVLGRLGRSMLAVICVLICTQLWWAPAYILSRDVRFLLFVILCFRGLLFIRRADAAPWEGRVARKLVVAIAALALVSATWADSTEYSLYQSVLFCLGLVVTFGVLWRLADDPAVMGGVARGAVILSVVLFGAGFIIAGVAYVADDALDLGVQRFEHLDLAGRYSGVFYNPNSAGMLGTMFLPMIVAAPRASLGRTASFRILAVVLTAATIFLSGSRSALIGASLALLLIALYRFGGGAVVTLVFGVTVVGILAVYNPVEDIDATAVGHITRTKGLSSLSGRVELWEQGWDEAQGHLTLGRGWGHSRLIGGDVDQERAIDVGSIVGGKNLHNAHLQLLIDVGVVGVALFWAFCLCVVHAGWCILRAPRNSENLVGVVIFTIVLALLADTWVHGSIWSMGSPMTLAFWGMCALTLKQGSRVRLGTPVAAATPAEWRPPPVPASLRT